MDAKNFFKSERDFQTANVALFAWQMEMIVGTFSVSLK